MELNSLLHLPPSLPAWIQKTVRLAYEEALAEEAAALHVRAHDLRAVSPPGIFILW